MIDLIAEIRRQFLIKRGQGELNALWQVDVPRYVDDIWAKRYADRGELRKTNRPGWPLEKDSIHRLPVVRRGRT